LNFGILNKVIGKVSIPENNSIKYGVRQGGSKLFDLSLMPIFSFNLIDLWSDNHYAGFGPGTANTFRKMLDLSEVTWNDVKVPQTERASGNTKQTSLSDFLKWY